MSELDRFDIAILDALQADSRLTSEVLGARVGLSPTACQRRLKRLRQSGAIAAEVAVISPDVVGGRITLIVQVVLARGSAQIIDTFKRAMGRVPEVQQCYYVTGEADFVLVVTARDMADYEAFTRRVFFEDPNIQKFNTTVVMENVKVGLQIPL